MGFSRQEYWSGLPCPPPGDLPDPGIKPLSPALKADSLLLSHQGNSYDRIHKKDDILPFATPWMDLDDFMLSETSEMEKEECI